MVNDLSSRFIEVVQYLIDHHIVAGNKDFASKIGISSSMVTEISKGRSNVGVSAIQNTVLLFSINADWLLTGRGSMIRNDSMDNASTYDTCKKKIDSSTEESILYKMYQQEKADKEAKIEEIGALKERIRQLESDQDHSKGLSDAKNASTKKPSSHKTDNADSVVVR